MENQQMENQEVKTQITVTGVLNLLENGVTRTPKNKGYDAEKGSIMERYNLTEVEVRELFKHPKLKGKRTVFEKKSKLSFQLVDDTVTDSTEAEGNLLDD